LLRKIAIIGGAGVLIVLSITFIGLALKPKVKQVARKEIIYRRDPEGRIIKVEEKSWTEWVENG